ncbi:MAG: hypothetical protein SP1CHLAM9_10850 [Chlamydiia bacterium]|nr:hypothetical protein [Chlamydiia bacterium]
MKHKYLIIFTILFTTHLFGSDLPSVVPDKLIMKELLNPLDRGYKVFSVSTGSLGKNQDFAPFLQVSLGQQTALKRTSFFQSYVYEVGVLINHEFIYPYPKITALHYWNLDSNNRIYTGIGAGIFIIPSFGLMPIPLLNTGIELGRPGKHIHKIELFGMGAVLGLSYTIGF